MNRRELIKSTLRTYKVGRLSELPSSMKLYKDNSKPCKQCRKSFKFVAHNTLYCESCKQKRKTIELGNLDIFREFNSIEYVLDCYFKLMISKSSGKIVNICSGITYSIAEIIDFTEILTNHQINVKVNQLFVRKNEISRLRGSTDLLESLIQIDLTKTNIHSTLKQMLFDEK